jgi:hypothetical protein
MPARLTAAAVVAWPLPPSCLTGKPTRVSALAPPRNRGGVAEWSIAAVLKTVGPHGPGGSNPSPSATSLFAHRHLRPASKRTRSRGCDHCNDLTTLLRQSDCAVLRDRFAGAVSRFKRAAALHSPDQTGGDRHGRRQQFQPGRQSHPVCCSNGQRGSPLHANCTEG